MSIIDHLVEVKLTESTDFLKIKETLTRIGIASKKDQTLFQSCHILHKRGKYYITHFKEMFLLDGRSSTLSEDDIARRNTIISRLAEWNLLSVVDPAKIEFPRAPSSDIKVLNYADKKSWNLVPKYNIGRKKTDE